MKGRKRSAATRPRRRITLQQLVQELGNVSDFAKDCAEFLNDCERSGVGVALAKARRFRLRVQIERNTDDDQR